MKKKLSFLIASLLLFAPATSFSKPATFQQEIDKKITCPNSIFENPPVYFYCIYSDYHNNRYDQGIEKAEKALKEIEPLLKKNPDAPLPNAVQKEGRLKDPRVRSVASDLHMLLGLLYYKKSTSSEDKEVKKVYREFFQNLEKKGFDFVQVNELLSLYTMKNFAPESFNEKRKKRYEELLKKMGLKEEDLKQLVERARKASRKESEKRLSYLKRAVEEFRKAVEVDPENADAYYQLGNLYSGALSESAPETSEAAAEAYYRAALIFKKRGDEKAYKEVLKRLKLVAPDPRYIEKLEKDDNA